MAVNQLLSHGRSKTDMFLKFCRMSQKWNSTSYQYSLPCFGADDLNKRHYSGFAACRPKLRLLKCQSSPSYITNSRRNISIDYNVFYLLIHAMECQFIFMKDTLGLEWWAVIMLCTVPYRLALAVYMKKMMVRHQHVSMNVIEERLNPLKKKELQAVKAMKKLSEMEKQKTFRKVMQQHTKRLCKEEKFNPYSSIIYSIAPVPFWISNSFALREMCGANIMLVGATEILRPDLQTGGCLWFTNLLAADPYHILPVAIGISFLMTNELNELLNYGKKNRGFYGKGMQLMTNMVKVWSIFAIYIFWNLPSAMTFYWFISGMTAFSVQLCFLHPEVQRRLTPPNCHPTVNEHPYQNLLTNMKKRYNPSNWFTS